MRSRLLLAALAIVGLSTGFALAGPSPVQWQGFYLGANGGVATTTSKWSETDGLGEFPPLSFGSAYGAIGGQAGYNWSLQNGWLLGIEGDLDWTGVDAHGTYCCGDGEAFSNKLNWFGTVRGRMGVLGPDGRSLFFGTAGVAFGGWQHAATDDHGTESLFSSDSTRVGYTLGGGVELALHDNWSVKADLLYMNFGSDTLAGIVPGEAEGYHAKVEDSAIVVRVGANKHF